MYDKSLNMTENMITVWICSFFTLYNITWVTFFSFPFWFFQQGKHENWNLSWFLKLQKWTKLWFVHNGYSFFPSITDLLHLEILFLVIPLCLLQLFSLLQSKIIALPSKNSAKFFVFLVFFCGPPVHFLQNIFCLVAKWLTTRM